jgi:hypothetical protein
MKLREVKSIVELGTWLQSVGVTPSEHPDFGGVHDVHTTGSLHYRGADDVADMKRQGSMAGHSMSTTTTRSTTRSARTSLPRRKA